MGASVERSGNGGGWQVVSHPQRSSIKEILAGKKEGTQVFIQGWVRSIRITKKFSFIVVNDGSCFSDLQIIADSTLETYPQVCASGVGAALCVTGVIVKSRGQNQAFELQAKTVQVVGGVDEDYPLQKKGHSLEFLREKAHLRPRTKTLSSIFRVRHTLCFATHRFFHDRGFYYLNAPIITGLDCEGAGEMFQVISDGGREDYFGHPAYLSVSGQLSAECFAQSMGACYTFGPTFRSEKSQTPRHLAEFWMIEPEVAFCDLDGLTQLASDYFQALIQSALDECSEELEFLHSQYAPHRTAQLQQIVTGRSVEVMSYGEAIDILQRSGKSFEFPVKVGKDLQTEHERYLAEEHCKGAVIVVDYPKEIKAFYMKQNHDGQTVRAMDFLVPGVGEVMGGSQREDDEGKLRQRMGELGLKEEHYWWYLELRRFGTTAHSGFGLGLERAVMYVTGMPNIRDVVAFPRSPGNAKF